MSCCREGARNGINSYSGMIFRMMYNQRIRRVLLQITLLLPKVERGGGEPSLQFQLINPLHLLSLKKRRRN
jgi:hypothetical protein